MSSRGDKSPSLCSWVAVAVCQYRTVHGPKVMSEGVVWEWIRFLKNSLSVVTDEPVEKIDRRIHANRQFSVCDNNLSNFTNFFVPYTVQSRLYIVAVE